MQQKMTKQGVRFLGNSPRIREKKWDCFANGHLPGIWQDEREYGYIQRLYCRECKALIDSRVIDW